MQFRSYLYLREIVGIRYIISHITVIVTGYRFLYLTHGIAHLWIFTVLSQLFTYISLYRGARFIFTLDRIGRTYALSVRSYR